MRQILDDAFVLDKQAATGEFAGRLHGAPLIIKDNIHVRDMPNTAGTPSLVKFVPKYDAPVIRALRNEGALFMAKANMHELALGVTSDNKTFGTCKNSKNIFYSPGGSSGGTAAAIGASLSPAGLGTDTMGSIRIPCSVNGITGLRPTHMRYSNLGVTPVALSRDTIGPMAKYVEDLVLLDEVISGEKFETDRLLAESDSLSNVRLGISSDYLCKDLEPEVEKAFENAKRVLEQSGAILVEVDSRQVKKANENCSFECLSYEMNQDLGEYLFQHDINLSLEHMSKQIASPDVKEFFKQVLVKGGKTKADFIELIHVRRPALKKAYSDIFSEHILNAFVFPTLACLPVRIDQVKEDTDRKFTRNLDASSQAG